MDINCYAYAIGRSQGLDPGSISGENDKNGDGISDYLLSGSVANVASCVKEDLLALGYTVTQYSQTILNTTVSDHVKLICVRTDTDGIQYYSFYDYHLMSKGEDGNWYHKPGFTHPLKYLYTPSNDRIWVAEWYDVQEEKYFRNLTYTYDSILYFIEYTTPHVYEYEIYGTDQHIRNCTICDDVDGTIMNCVYINDVCKMCGRIKITSGGVITSIDQEESDAA